MLVPTEHRVDEIDRKIIAELSRNGRLSVRRLAELVHISRTNAHNRLVALLDAQVITGFSAQVDRKALGLNVTALVIAKIGDVPWPDVSARLAALPFVEKVQAVSGDIDVMLTVSAPDNRHLSDTILRRIHEVPGVESTRSLLILEEIPGQAPGTAADEWPR
ncbi:Lrp/AsnC family transcriptional regulator [Spelaeicoccus albus]|nr:Lrp/AsnC family transcriptional regulator [Spelaeicoccus albus]